MLDDHIEDDEECQCTECCSDRLIDVLSDILSIHFLIASEGDIEDIADRFKDFGEILHSKIALKLAGHNGESIN